MFWEARMHARNTDARKQYRKYQSTLERNTAFPAVMGVDLETKNLNIHIAIFFTERPRANSHR